MNNEQTIGESRVRVAFNPANDSVVDKLKQKTAELINICEDLKSLDSRTAELAQDAYEKAVMWAVKSATSNL